MRFISFQQGKLDNKSNQLPKCCSHPSYQFTRDVTLLHPESTAWIWKEAKCQAGLYGHSSNYNTKCDLCLQCSLSTLTWSASPHRSKTASKSTTLDSEGVPLLVYLPSLIEKVFLIFLNSLCIEAVGKMTCLFLFLVLKLLFFSFPVLHYVSHFRGSSLARLAGVSSHPLWTRLELSVVGKG